jgi:hypothetical protein
MHLEIGRIRPKAGNLLKGSECGAGHAEQAQSSCECFHGAQMIVCHWEPEIVGVMCWLLLEGVLSTYIALQSYSLST